MQIVENRDVYHRHYDRFTTHYTIKQAKISDNIVSWCRGINNSKRKRRSLNRLFEFKNLPLGDPRNCGDREAF